MPEQQGEATRAGREEVQALRVAGTRQPPDLVADGEGDRHRVPRAGDGLVPRAGRGRERGEGADGEACGSQMRLDFVGRVGGDRERHGEVYLIHKALDDAVRKGEVVRNVAAFADQPPVPRREMQVWWPEQTRAFLAAVEDHRLSAAWLLFCTTGMRRSEVCGLAWSSVDLELGGSRSFRPRSWSAAPPP